MKGGEHSGVPRPGVPGTLRDNLYYTTINTKMYGNICTKHIRANDEVIYYYT